MESHDTSFKSIMNDNSLVFKCQYSRQRFWKIGIIYHSYLRIRTHCPLRTPCFFRRFLRHVRMDFWPSAASWNRYGCLTPTRMESFPGRSRIVPTVFHSLPGGRRIPGESFHGIKFIFRNDCCEPSEMDCSRSLAIPISPVSFAVAHPRETMTQRHGSHRK